MSIINKAFYLLPIIITRLQSKDRYLNKAFKNDIAFIVWV
jgi:hypothetical protein